ncbi:hypothetical protein TIFTF001_019796 [Ficus carica]|uniref:rRNA methyltransferase 1, mitochondrial n=1 Tax=Ficus carica TaxID=3494 RepID=A0AA88DJH1_FICCA|nr:hypothetical protein TIFTF001_019796 [Ficus carica]
MYTSLAKSPAFPLAMRVFTPKFQSLPIGSVEKLNFSSYSYRGVLGASGLWLKTAKRHSLLVKTRSFSDSSTKKINGEKLPWLRDGNKVGREREIDAKTIRSSWEESAKRLDKDGAKSSWEESAKRLDRESGKSFRGEDRRGDYVSAEKRFQENVEVEEEEEEAEIVGDPRWDRINSRFRGVVDAKDGYEKPELRRWNKQENWGRRTWKEATESTVPKMVGEGVYGIGPVLAALSAGRREFYALYVQEGLDLSGNNRKKKDKKGFEKILKMAEKLGLRINEVSKHDLNMVVDNRPHQGLVLDASPLEMIKIKELDPVSVEEDKNSLWVALDEVTDPQNLGAIIRSAYFFGASGVVLCAKNSAPLSGVVSKASAGSLELMELRYCKNMMQFLISSAENGWRVLGGSVSSKAIPLNEVIPGAPTILVLGSEGTGLRPLVERSCTQLVKIPSNVPVDIIPGGEPPVETAEKNSGCSAAEFQSFLAVESLNVSVAAGVLLHHLIGDNYYKNDTDKKIDQPTNAVE